MQTILVLNSKGGSGKTTLATNLAGYYAAAGRSVALVDYDPQASATDWVSARPAERPSIHGVQGWKSGARVPGETEVVVMDAPAGTHGRVLNEMLKRAQSVVVPVLPSPVDLNAAMRLHEELLSAPALIDGEVRIATVANRVRETSPSRFVLEHFLSALTLPGGGQLPFVALLRNTAYYGRVFERGLSIFEVAPAAMAHDVELWQPLLRWLKPQRARSV